MRCKYPPELVTLQYVYSYFSGDVEAHEVKFSREPQMNCGNLSPRLSFLEKRTAKTNKHTPAR